MADNYIERQFEQYQAKKAAWQKPLKHTSKKTNSKRVFITGGANGIGKAIVKAFRQKNYPVAFCDKDETSGLQTAKETGAAFYLVDIQNKEALENCMLKIIKRWGDIDILINNAGVSLFSDLTETSVEDFDQILSINLRPVFITSRLLAIHRKAQDSPQHYGRIINICSTRHLMSEPGSEGYAASKGGIYSLTHALALSLAKQHITVNSISPGWIDTDFKEYQGPDALQQPAGRVGNPLDIANMVLFLCSPRAGFINGENICIDGGMTRQMIYHGDFGWKLEADQG